MQPRFNAVVFLAAPEEVEIHYLERQHFNQAGVTAHPEGPPLRYLSPELRFRVQQALLRQVPARFIVEQIQKDHLQDFRAKHNLPSMDEAEVRMAVRFNPLLPICYETGCQC
jgi:hypothetical protein